MPSIATLATVFLSTDFIASSVPVAPKSEVTPHQRAPYLVSGHVKRARVIAPLHVRRVVAAHRHGPSGYGRVAIIRFLYATRSPTLVMRSAPGKSKGLADIAR